MLRTLSSLYRYTLHTREGELGNIADAYFEDETWVIRYLVVDLNRWLPGRKVLVPPAIAERPKDETGQLPVEMTRESVRTAPDFKTEQPVSRQLEDRLHSFFGWQPYWAGEPEGGQTSPRVPSGDEMTGDREADSTPKEAPTGNPNLRSARDLIGYKIEAATQPVGTLTDLLVDDESWMVRYLVIDVGQPDTTRQVVIAADTVEKVDWHQFAIFLDLERDSVERAPSFEAAPVLPEALERQLERHFHS